MVSFFISPCWSRIIKEKPRLGSVQLSDLNLAGYVPTLSQALFREWALVKTLKFKPQKVGLSITQNKYNGPLVTARDRCPTLSQDTFDCEKDNIVTTPGFSVRVYQRDVKNIVDMAMDVSAERVEEMQKQVSFVYNKYFSSWKSVTKTMLDILNDRIVPQHTKTYREWNLRPEEYKRNPLFLPDANPGTLTHTELNWFNWLRTP